MIRIRFRSVCIFLLGFLLTGCGDFFEKQPTELESHAVIRDIARVQENPHVGNPLPEVYTEGPKRLHVEDGVKLFYFTKYLPVGDLTYTNSKNKALETLTHGYAGTIQDLGFKVSSNPTTNQLIIHCANDAECDQVLEYLKRTDVPPIQVHIDCIILERFGDVTQDWETTLLIENLFGQKITLGESKYPNPAFPGASLRESRRSEFGLDFGYWRNEGIPGHQVRAIVDMLESRGYLKILLNPTLDTVNGKSAQVSITDQAPIEKTVTEKGNVSYTVTDYQAVSDTLKITPNVYSDGSIGLETDIVIGSKSKPEGVVQTSIITERSIHVDENRIEPGKSLIIGGMRRSENRSVVRGVPFFKDLPLVGVLFSSKDYEDNATEIVFILTPTISSEGTEYKQMADMVRKRFETPAYSPEIEEVIMDPLGAETYSGMVQKKTDEAAAQMVRLQVEAAETSRSAEAEKLRAEKAEAEVKAIEVQLEEAKAQIDKLNAQKLAFESEQKALAKEAKAQEAQMTQTQGQIEKLQAEAENARAAAEQARSQMQQAEKRAKDLAEQARQARQKAESIQQKIETLEKTKEPDQPETEINKSEGNSSADSK